MVSLIAGRLITGPLAFLLAGVLDVGAFLAAVGRERLRRAWRSRARHRPRGS